VLVSCGTIVAVRSDRNEEEDDVSRARPALDP
jgi:hypothetical protein